jgi:hypothetical protein
MEFLLAVLAFFESRRRFESHVLLISRKSELGAPLGPSASDWMLTVATAGLALRSIFVTLMVKVFPVLAQFLCEYAYPYIKCAFK